MAIASIGGPASAVGAALGEIVRFGRRRIDENADTRDLHRQVTASISAWARGSGDFTHDDLEIGLLTAKSVVERNGLDAETIVDRNLGADETAKIVVAAARARDPAWGKEPHYEVAERAIELTYRVLVNQLRNRQDLLLPALQAVRASIDERVATLQAQGHAALEKLDELTEAITAAATTTEVMAYLNARIVDWDESAWRYGRQASHLERPLSVHVHPQGSGVAGEHEAADDSLLGERMLVVLGGPGSGKSWLARRYARKAAVEALTLLEAGANLDEVELPLLTTWDAWTKSPGTTRESLVEASFGASLGYVDLDDGAHQRLRRSFKQPRQRVLVVVDSLDEAADLTQQAGALRALMALLSWRVVVTSRPSAWSASFIRMAKDSGVRVVEIDRLNYPEDVQAFLNVWFASDLPKGAALMKQIDSNAALGRLATIPLFLTFFTVLADESPAEHVLPTRLRELYRRLSRRLLRGMWANNAPGPDAAPDIAAAEALLAEWAWSAVVDRTTPAGLGDWGTHSCSRANHRRANHAQWTTLHQRSLKTMKVKSPAGSCTARCWSTLWPSTSQRSPPSGP